MFRRETLAVRPCLVGGTWGAPDITTCTLQADPEPFLILWFVIEADENAGFSADGTPDEETRLFLETEVVSYTTSSLLT